MGKVFSGFLIFTATMCAFFIVGHRVFAQSTLTNLGYETQRPGMENSYIERIQILLNYESCGSAGLPAQGYFGPNTEEAIKNFQKSFFGGDPIEADGLVGNMTKKKLISCSTNSGDLAVNVVQAEIQSKGESDQNNFLINDPVSAGNDVIIVHGCPYEDNWTSWLKRELEDLQMTVAMPRMPNSSDPRYREFREVFNDYQVTPNTILVGHSCGAAFLVQWLGETKQEVKKLILVAPWRIPRPGDPSRKTIYQFPIDTTINDRVPDITIFTSDNENIYRKASLEILHNAIGGDVIELHNKGHYSMTDMQTSFFPEILEEILRFEVEPGVELEETTSVQQQIQIPFSRLLGESLALRLPKLLRS